MSVLIRTLENKLKLAFIVSICSFIASIIIIICVLYFAYGLVQDERNNVYVLDAGVPVLVQRTSIEDNEEVEMKSHINMFHMLFFNLPPDDKFIKDNIEKSMYLIDKSGTKQYNDLREQGFYNQILANSMMLSIKADSVVLNLSDSHNKKFTYYGTQRIERETTIVKRRLVTTGTLRRVKRSDNNPHGFLIENWKTISNEDIEEKNKRNM